MYTRVKPAGLKTKDNRKGGIRIQRAGVREKTLIFTNPPSDESGADLGIWCKKLSPVEVELGESSRNFAETGILGPARQEAASNRFRIISYTYTLVIRKRNLDTASARRPLDLNKFASPRRAGFDFENKEKEFKVSGDIGVVFGMGWDIRRKRKEFKVSGDIGVVFGMGCTYMRVRCSGKGDSEFIFIGSRMNYLLDNKKAEVQLQVQEAVKIHTNVKKKARTKTWLASLSVIGICLWAGSTLNVKSIFGFRPEVQRSTPSPNGKTPTAFKLKYIPTRYTVLRGSKVQDVQYEAPPSRKYTTADLDPYSLPILGLASGFHTRSTARREEGLESRSGDVRELRNTHAWMVGTYETAKKKIAAAADCVGSGGGGDRDGTGREELTRREEKYEKRGLGRCHCGSSIYDLWLGGLGLERNHKPGLGKETATSIGECLVHRNGLGTRGAKYQYSCVRVKRCTRARAGRFPVSEQDTGDAIPSAQGRQATKERLNVMREREEDALAGWDWLERLGSQRSDVSVEREEETACRMELERSFLRWDGFSGGVVIAQGGNARRRIEFCSRLDLYTELVAGEIGQEIRTGVIPRFTGCPDQGYDQEMSAITQVRRAAPESHVFRPRPMPLDPFAPAQPPQTDREPQIDPDTPWPAYDLPALSYAFAHTPAVILVLGAPNPHLLSPLLRSPTFTRSLVLLVTHAPPPLTALVSAIGRESHAAGTHPAVRVLRLRAPLVPSAPTFALTLVSVLDAAATVARSWRASLSDLDSPSTDNTSFPPSPDRIAQLAQNPSGHDSAFCVPEPLADFPASTTGAASPLPSNNEHLHPAGRRAASTSASTPATPNGTTPPSTLSRAPSALFNPKRASTSALSLSKNKSAKRPSTADSVSVRSNTSNTSKRSSFYGGGKSTSTATAHANANAKTKNDGTRPFDALLSFLPAQQQEKAILKQVVLVSTLAGGFLAGRGGGGVWNVDAGPCSSRRVACCVIREGALCRRAGRVGRAGPRRTGRDAGCRGVPEYRGQRGEARSGCYFIFWERPGTHTFGPAPAPVSIAFFVWGGGGGVSVWNVVRRCDVMWWASRCRFVFCGAVRRARAGATQPDRTRRDGMDLPAHSYNSSADTYTYSGPNSRGGSGTSTPQSTYSYSSPGTDGGFTWNSAPASPSATHSHSAFTSTSTSVETSRPGTPDSQATRTEMGTGTGTRKKKRFSLFGGGGGDRDRDSGNESKRASKSTPASLRGSVYFDSGDDAAMNPSMGVGLGGGGRGPRGHIIHVLPASYRSPKLVGALSAFLATFSPAGVALSANAGMGSEGGERGGGGGGKKAKAYVMAERALGAAGVVGGAGGVGALECVLVGALEARGLVVLRVNGSGNGAGAGRERRHTGAWIAGVVVAAPPMVAESSAESPEAEVLTDAREFGHREHQHRNGRERETEGMPGEGGGGDGGLGAGMGWEGGLPTPPASRSGSDEAGAALAEGSNSGFGEAEAGSSPTQTQTQTQDGMHAAFVERTRKRKCLVEWTRKRTRPDGVLDLEFERTCEEAVEDGVSISGSSERERERCRDCVPALAACRSDTDDARKGVVVDKWTRGVADVDKWTRGVAYVDKRAHAAAVDDALELGAWPCADAVERRARRKRKWRGVAAEDAVEDFRVHRKLRRASTSTGSKGPSPQMQLATGALPPQVQAQTQKQIASGGVSDAQVQVLRTPSGRRRVESAPEQKRLSKSAGKGKTWARGSKLFFGGKAPGDFSLRPPPPSSIATSTSEASAATLSPGPAPGKTKKWARSAVDVSVPSAGEAGPAPHYATVRMARQMGRSSPDLRELSSVGGGDGKGRKRWWAFWGR
ncbi:hypothetical protein K438DRAFT_1936598 [Mycena galopus ATCC 62051]|nr:hypothetical protein K438DRAFT_1936598 [Mycena galopus ATCC 62051]